MKQTILVTGGTGFIGSHTSVELIGAGYDVVIVDDLSNSKIEVLDGIEKITGVRPAFEQVDLRFLLTLCCKKCRRAYRTRTERFRHRPTQSSYKNLHKT